MPSLRARCLPANSRRQARNRAAVAALRRSFASQKPASPRPDARCTPLAKVFPCERSEAASAVISNCGWFSSNWMKRCPTMPVAPSIPTRSFLVIVKFLGARFHSCDAFGQYRQVRAERNSQKAFSFTAKGVTRDRNHAPRQQCFGNFHRRTILARHPPSYRTRRQA